MDNQENVERGPAASFAPADHSPVVSGSRIESFGYALSGCRHMLRWQKNTRILSAATVIVAIVAIWSDISALEWAALILTVAPGLAGGIHQCRDRSGCKSWQPQLSSDGESSQGCSRRRRALDCTCVRIGRRANPGSADLGRHSRSNCQRLNHCDLYCPSAVLSRASMCPTAVN